MRKNKVFSKVLGVITVMLLSLAFSNFYKSNNEYDDKEITKVADNNLFNEGYDDHSLLFYYLGKFVFSR